MAAAKNMLGAEMARRKSCKDSRLSEGDWVTNGPCPYRAPQMVKAVSTRIEALVPPGPKRTAAQRTNGNGAYNRTGRLLGPPYGRKDQDPNSKEPDE
jgi:hypothetical protein